MKLLYRKEGSAVRILLGESHNSYIVHSDKPYGITGDFYLDDCLSSWKISSRRQRIMENFSTLGIMVKA